MTVLGETEIRKQILYLEKYSRVNPASVDVSIGRNIIYYNSGIHSRITLEDRGSFYVPEGYSVLVHTQQYVVMPPDVAGMLVLKSSRIREGWSLASPGWIDNGFEGELTTMIHAVGKNLSISLGQPFAQIIFHPVLGDGKHYGQQEDAHYQGSTGLTTSWAAESDQFE